MSKKDDLEELEQHQRKSQDAAAGSGRWLISYADFITLLLAFFIVMFSISQINKAKVEGFERSVNMAFGGKPPVVRVAPPQANEPFHHLPSPIPLVAVPPAIRSAILRQTQIMARMRSELRKALAPLIQAHEIHVIATPTGTRIRINADVLFKNGSARLQPKALAIVDAIGKILSRFHYPIAVDGYANRVPIHTARYPSNWYLSVARSLSVLNRFLHDGIRPDLLRATGYGPTHPAVPYSPKLINKALIENRRVTIFVQANTAVIMKTIDALVQRKIAFIRHNTRR
ncbi:flagellar motor protein MotB [Acidithiobacillus caldus]|uniref:flagellar motor protein MotB n=1 Tax=Acidithiobacillus caldus TaxID=33059 RepID=UPI000571191A|nr:flagellar motor protein MotB [Acidithiobacillus caldus]MBU2729630.1 OmpA family protein [Acidithiobacillus caldus]MBU2734229.1 OmpA family protein [Acidithiobacillus caldus ATCC 51756]MBU2746075.1 OmpA family protein [Acidithiobacillus caldus]MBU2779670.1 OmpA family protein [Acidithiobacillus caldus]